MPYNTMENYTPLPKKLLGKNTKEQESPFSTVLLLMATITALILAVLLFFLIQRKIKDQKQMSNDAVPTISIEPTHVAEPTLEQPTPTTGEQTLETSSTPSAEISPMVSLVPTVSESTESGTASP